MPLRAVKKGKKKYYKRKRPYYKRKYRITRPISARIVRISRAVNYNSSNTLSFLSGYNGSSVVKGVDGIYIDTGNAAVAANTYHSFAMYFKLDEVPNYNYFTTLYDRYMLSGVKITFTPFAGGGDNTDYAGYNTPLTCLYTIVRDYDDGIPITANATNFEAYKQRAYSKSGNFLKRKKVSIFIRPHIAIPAFQGITSGYTNQRGMWIDQNYPSIEHYGVKGMFQVFSPNGSVHHFVWFKVDVTYYLKFKDPI